MKKVMMIAAIAAALVSCQSKGNQNNNTMDGELGKEFVISAQRKGQYIIACDSYAGATNSDSNIGPCPCSIL